MKITVDVKIETDEGSSFSNTIEADVDIGEDMVPSMEYLKILYNRCLFGLGYNQAGFEILQKIEEELEEDDNEATCH